MNDSDQFQNLKPYIGWPDVASQRHNEIMEFLRDLYEAQGKLLAAINKEPVDVKPPSPASEVLGTCENPCNGNILHPFISTICVNWKPLAIAERHKELMETFGKLLAAIQSRDDADAALVNLWQKVDERLDGIEAKQGTLAGSLTALSGQISGGFDGLAGLLAKKPRKKARRK